MKTTCIAATAVVLSLMAATSAGAAAHPLVSGQTLSLALNDEADGPALKLVVTRAALDGYMFEAVRAAGESGAEYKAREHQVVLDSPEGADLVKFVHAMADTLRTRYAAASPVRATAVSITVDEKLKIDGGNLMGDALKAGFTLGLGSPSTTPLNFLSHMDVTVEGADGAKTYACDTITPGRPPRTPRKNDPHQRDEYTRMYDVGRRACLAQVIDQLDGKPAAPAAGTPAAAAAAKAPAAGAAKPTLP